MERISVPPHPAPRPARRRPAAALCALLALSQGPRPSAPSGAAGDKLDGALQRLVAERGPDARLEALLYLGDACDLAAIERQLDRERAGRAERHRVVVQALMDKAAATQGPLLVHLGALQAEGRVGRVTPLWIANAVAVEAPGAELIALARRPDVARVRHDVPIATVAHESAATAPVGPARGPDGADTPEPGLVAIRVPEAWARGFNGAGRLVSSLDTGVHGPHPALRTRWRGLDPAYAGHPEWAWFDPVTGTHQPSNLNSAHGTATMGVLCGGAPGDAVGVAPGAQWISAAVIARGTGDELSLAMQAFQWTADPDGDPRTVDDVPDVSSNSWGSAAVPACDEGLWSFLDGVEAAGVVVVFAVGNEGTGPVLRPMDRATDEWRSFTVGALRGNDPGLTLWENSSRGPSVCTPDGSAAVKPELAAPGVNVRTCAPIAFPSYYVLRTGTSYAAPHVAGVVALMRQADPDITVKEVKAILLATATDLGAPGEDNGYGHGLVDAAAAVEAVLARRVIRVPSEQPTLADAVAAASAGATVLLADGIYAGAANRGLVLERSLTIASENGPQACVLDAEGLDFGLLARGPLAHVTLAGLTIRRGAAPAANDGLGGGLLVRDGARATLRDCRIEACRASAGGGGIAFSGGRELDVERCVVEGNEALGAGARGGGLLLELGPSTETVRIADARIAGNASFGGGGGLHVFAEPGSDANVELRNLTLAENRVVGRSPRELGGGMRLETPGAVLVRNCILWGNDVDSDPGHGGRGDELALAPGSSAVLVLYSDVRGGAALVPGLDPFTQWGPGNLDVDPLFQDPPGDYHLRKTSPCVNAGDPAFVPGPDATDLDGQPRLSGARVDMGADERPMGTR